MKNLFFVLIGVCILFNYTTNAQITTSTNDEKELQNFPYWIAMINDSTANYFAAEKAFNQYWSVRTLPKEEDEILGEGEQHKEQENFIDRLVTTKKEKREMESQQYAFDYKRFKQWQLRMEPWVQPDGSITFPTERLVILNSRKN